MLLVHCRRRRFQKRLLFGLEPLHAQTGGLWSVHRRHLAQRPPLLRDRSVDCSEDDQNGAVAFISDAPRPASTLALQVLRRHFRTNLISPLKNTEESGGREAPFSLRSNIKGAPPKRSVGRTERRFFAAAFREGSGRRKNIVPRPRPRHAPALPVINSFAV